MRKTLVSTIALVGLLAVFAGGNAGQASSKVWQGGAVKAVLSANAGHRPRAHFLPSGGFQVGVEDTIRAATGGAQVRAPQIPPTQNSDGCSNVYTKAGAGLKVPDNIRANQDCSLRRQAEEQIANNPLQPKNFVIGQNDSRLGFNRQGVDYTFDNGLHFGDYQPPSTQTQTSTGDEWTFDAVSDPTEAWGPNGEMYFGAVMFDVLHDGWTSIYVMKSNAGLKGTFLHSPDTPEPGSLDEYSDTPVGLVHDNFADPSLSDDKEFLAADYFKDSPYSGNVYMLWTIFKFDDVQCAAGGGYCSSPIFFSKSTDGGATWNGGTSGEPGPPIEVSGNNPDVCQYGDLFDPSRDPNDCDFDQGAFPVVGSDGSINVTFENCNVTIEGAEGPGLCQNLFVRSTDAGVTWSDPVHVGDVNATEPLNTGNLGAGCPLFRQCLPPNGYRIGDFPAMGINSTSGKLAVFWTDFRNGDPDTCAASATNCNEDVFASTSKNNGQTWSDTIQVTNDPSAQYYAWGDVDEHGGLYVGYYTRQFGDCEATGCGDYRLSTSSDNGVSWSQRRITTSSMPNLTDVTNPVQQGFIGDYTSIHVAGNSVYLAWADTRGLNGTVEEDVYFARVPALTKAID